MKGKDAEQTQYMGGHGNLLVYRAESCGEDIMGEAVTCLF